MSKELLNVSTLPDEVKKLVREQGADPEDLIFQWDADTEEGKFIKKSDYGNNAGYLKTLASEAGQGILPTGIGMAAGAGVTALSAPTGPAAPFIGAGAGIGTAIGSQYLQEKALSSLAPDLKNEMDILRMSNPKTATLGQVLAGIPFGLNSLKGLANIVGGKANAVKVAATPVALGAGLEAYNEQTTEGQIDPLRVGIAGLGNIFQIVNTKGGDLAEAFGRKLVGKGNTAKVISDTPRLTHDMASELIMKAHEAGQFTEGSAVHKQLAAGIGQPDASADHLLSIASRHKSMVEKNSPEVRVTRAAELWDNLSKGLPAETLANSPLEAKLKKFVADGVISNKDDLVRVAKAASQEEALAAIQRERANAAGPVKQPGTRYTDEEVEALFKSPPDILPPNASPLDKAVQEGRKKGFINSVQDFREVEDAYLINPTEGPPAALRTIWNRKQMSAASPTAEELADAVKRRDIDYLATELPKEMRKLKSAKASLDKLAKTLNDKNMPEATKALQAAEYERKVAALNKEWDDLGKKVLSRPPEPEVTEPIKHYPVEDTPLLPSRPPELDVEAQGMLQRANTELVNRQASGASIDPNTGTKVYHGGLDPNQNIRKAVEWYAPGIKEDVRYSGAPPSTLRKLLEAANIPKHLYEHLGSASTMPVMERIKRLGPSGEIIAELDNKLKRDYVKTFNTAGRMYAEAYKSLDKAETARVNRYLEDMRDNGDSFLILTDKEQQAVKQIREGLLYLADNGIVRGGPGVNDAGQYRNLETDPNYIPHTIDEDVRKIAKAGGAAAEQLYKDWEAWYVRKLGLSAEEAATLRNNYLEAIMSSDPRDSMRFNAITKAEGVGLPPSWRADTRKSLLYHAHRAAKNYAWFTHVQRNPDAAKILGVTDNGWGGTIDTSASTAASLSANPSVQAWLREVGGSRVNQDWISELTRVFSSIQLGPLTGMRDLVSTPAHLAELMPVGEADKTIKALLNVMTRDVRGDMERSGLLKAKELQPFEFLTPGYGEETLDRVVEASRRLQGRNLLESGARQWAYEIGRLVAQSRLAKGDMAYFEKLDLPGYRNLKPEDLVEAVGAKFVETSQGNYDANSLPSYLLSSSEEQRYIKNLLSLQRWSVGRFNHWYKNAWMPAMERGEFGPLLKSILAGAVTGSGVEALAEILFNQKPREMTWKEYSRAQDPELVYTLFSKLQNAGYAGLFGNLLYQASRVKGGEIPEGVQNLGIDSAAMLGLRLKHLVDAYQSRGGASWDLLFDFLDTVAKDNMQAYRLIRNANRPDTGQREERLFQRSQGKSQISAGLSRAMSNPMDPMYDLRRATTLEEVNKALPVAASALANNPELNPRFNSSLRSLEQRPSYYDFVEQIQGELAGQQALARDLQSRQLAREKTVLLRQEARKVGGPP